MSDINLNPLAITKLCRACLEEKNSNFNLTTNIKFETNVDCISICEILSRMSFEKIESELDLPALFCTDCFILLKSAYIFKLKYDYSTNILKQYLETYVKEESDGAIRYDIEDDDTEIEFDAPACETLEVNSTPKLKKKNTVTLHNYQPPEETHNDSKNNTYPCPICTIELPALELRKHAHTHKSLKKYLSIPKIERISKSNRFYAQRSIKQSFFSQSVINHKCPFCNTCLPFDEFRIHIDQHRNQNEFKCDQCNRVFKKLNHLNTHKVTHLKECPYKCDICDKGFVIKKNYDCHMLTHTDNELPHECSYCLKRFSNPEHLNRHQIIHTENISYSVKYKVCKCSHCLKTFRDKDALLKHECTPLTDTIKPTYHCKICKKEFKYYHSVYNHNRIVHQAKVKKTLCPVCGVHVSNIYTHNLKHTGEKPYPCTQCEKRFQSKRQLSQHLLVHSGLKPFVCSVCAKAFNNLYNLQVHERIHKGDRCHICSICHKGFLEKSYLKKHMNVHKKV